MQAFFYHHLVAAQEWTITIRRGGMFQKPIQDAFALNLRQVLPHVNGTEPVSFPLRNNGILQLGAVQLTVVSVKSVEASKTSRVRAMSSMAYVK